MIQSKCATITRNPEIPRRYSVCVRNQAPYQGSGVRSLSSTQSDGRRFSNGASRSGSKPHWKGSPPRDERRFETQKGSRGDDRSERQNFQQQQPRMEEPHGDDESNWEEEEEEEGQRGYPYAGNSSRRGDVYERPPNIRDQLVEDVLFGVFPVLNALKTRKRKLHAIYVLSSLDLSKRKDAAAMREIFKLVKELDIPIHKAPRHELNLLSDDRPHQGLVLDCSGLQWSSLDTFPSAFEIASTSQSTLPVWLALDEVVDPQNFGAIVRSAHCLGASGILACSRNCAPLSPTVSKASAGVLEVIAVHSCQNMVKTLAQAVADGWDVLGAVADPKAQECRSVRVTKPTILVVGNEGSGLRTNVRRACSGFIKVEMGLPRQRLAADSLNVSVAAGILMHSVLGAAQSSSLPDAISSDS